MAGYAHAQSWNVKRKTTSYIRLRHFIILSSSHSHIVLSHSRTCVPESQSRIRLGLLLSVFMQVAYSSSAIRVARSTSEELSVVPFNLPTQHTHIHLTHTRSLTSLCPRHISLCVCDPFPPTTNPPPSRWICRASLLETTGFLLCITPSTDCLSVSSAVFALALFPSHSSIQR